MLENIENWGKIEFKESYLTFVYFFRQIRGRKINDGG